VAAGPELLPEGLEAQVTGKAPDDLVFPLTKGWLLGVANFRRGCFGPGRHVDRLVRLLPARAAARRPDSRSPSGASIKGVLRMLGHACATLTLDRYGHLFLDELDTVADRLDQARADSLRTAPARGQ
jgi:hypothetical protein